MDRFIALVGRLEKELLVKWSLSRTKKGRNLL